MFIGTGRVSFRGNGAVSPRIMHPNRTLPRENRSDKRAPIGSHGHAVLFLGTRGNLLRLAVGKTLAPQMALPSHGGSKIHPASVRRPARRGASAWRPHPPARRSARQRNQPARQPIGIHLHHQRPLPVRRRIGIVRHTALVRREVNSRCADRFSVAVTIPMCAPVFVPRIADVCSSNQVRPAALGRNSVESPPSEDTVYVFQPLGSSTNTV